MAGDVAGPTTDPVRDARARAAVDVALLAALAIAIAVLFLRPAFARDTPFPVGPDVPVYLWWARAAISSGLSVVAGRPGTPALLPTTAGVLGIGLVPALAGLQYAMGPAIGLAAAALLRGSDRNTRMAWVIGGLLAGVWATHLGDGYLANLAFVAPYLAAAAALAARTRRGTIAAAILLGGGGLAHPQFFLIGAVIFAITAVASWVAERHGTWKGDARRIVGAVGGGAAVVALAMLASFAGPSPIRGDTSKDAFLRRVGQWATLRNTYLHRFGENWRRYSPIMNGALSILGLFQGRGFSRRFLLAWLTFSAVALPLGVLTGWYPPDRILTFAFWVPLLSALGLAWIADRLGRWWLAWPAVALLVVLTTIPILRGWDHTGTFVSPDELRDATLAGRIAATTAPGTPLVFVVNDPKHASIFLVSHALNVARATVPPDRIGDVYVFLGTTGDLLARHSTARGDPIYDLASSASLADIPSRPKPAVFVVREFNLDPAALDDPRLQRWDVGVASSVGGVRTLPAADGELEPSSPGDIAGATVRTMILLFVLGSGWSWWAFGDAARATAAAMAFGVAVLTLAAFVLERIGLPLGTAGTSALASGLAGGSGYALAVVRHVRDRDDLGRGGLILEGETEVDP